jgi:hypothetical protein
MISSPSDVRSPNHTTSCASRPISRTFSIPVSACSRALRSHLSDALERPCWSQPTVLINATLDQNAKQGGAYGIVSYSRKQALAQLKRIQDSAGMLYERWTNGTKSVLNPTMIAPEVSTRLCWTATEAWRPNTGLSRATAISGKH